MKTIYSIYIFAFILSIVSCKKEEETIPVSQLIKISEAYNQAGIKVSLFSKDSLSVGYNQIYIQLKDSVSGSLIKQANVSLEPLMKMTNMTHSCPFENPRSTSANDDGYFKAAAVFILPSNDLEYWTLSVNVNLLDNSKVGTINPRVLVKNSSNLKSFTSSVDQSKIYISILQPTKPVVGINDIEFVICKKATMMSFSAETDFNVTITPTSPSMGHGSPNNINPVHTNFGHYKGKVNFTMSGLWRVDLSLSRKGLDGKDDSFFDITI